MLAFRKISFFIALMGFSAFFSLSIAENFHHHGDLESHDDCSLCSWQQADSKAITVAAPVLVFALLCFVLIVRAFVLEPIRLIQAAPGRSPPVLL